MYMLFQIFYYWGCVAFSVSAIFHSFEFSYIYIYISMQSYFTFKMYENSMYIYIYPVAKIKLYFIPET